MLIEIHIITSKNDVMMYMIFLNKFWKLDFLEV